LSLHTSTDVLIDDLTYFWIVEERAAWRLILIDVELGFSTWSEALDGKVTVCFEIELKSVSGETYALSARDSYIDIPLSLILSTSQ
jgi:hypothetical protein